MFAQLPQKIPGDGTAESGNIEKEFMLKGNQIIS
jgi:hypothetical protein